MAEFRIAVSVINSSVSVCKLSGALDAEHFDTVMEEMDKLVDSAVLGLILDMSEVTAAGCPVFGVLVHAARILRNRGGRLVVAGPVEAVKRFADLIDLGEIVDIVENMEQARKLVSDLR